MALDEVISVLSWIELFFLVLVLDNEVREDSKKKKKI